MSIQERRARERHQRQEAILRAAEKLFIANSYNTTTIADIAREAEISKGAVYLYFQSKEQIYDVVLSTAFAPLREAIAYGVQEESNALDQLENIWNIGRQYAVDFPDYFRLLYSLTAWAAQLDSKAVAGLQCRLEIESIVQLISQIICRGQVDGSLIGIENPDLVAKYYWRAMLECIQIAREETDIKQITFEQHAAVLSRVLLRAIRR
jgi:AcrR family transcriptional regulator